MPQKTPRISRLTFLNVLSQISGMYAVGEITEQTKNELSQVAGHCFSGNSWDPLLDYCSQAGLIELQEFILLT